MKTIFLIAVTAIISSSIQAQTKAAWVIPGVDNSPALTDFAITLTSVDTTVSNFAGNAMMINVMEMEASKIAQTQAWNSGAKDYANMIIKKHINANNQFKSGLKTMLLPTKIEYETVI